MSATRSSFYTDGVIDARNTENWEFGEESLLALVKNNIKLPAEGSWPSSAAS